MSENFDAAVPHITAAWQEIDHRLETLPMLFVGRVVPSFFKDLASYKAELFPPSFVEAISWHVARREQLIASGQSLINAIADARMSFTHRVVMPAHRDKMNGEKVEAIVSTYTSGFKHKKLSVANGNIVLKDSFTAFDIYTFFSSGEPDAIRLDEAENRFSANIAKEFEGKKAEINDVVSLVAAKTGLGRKDVVELLVPSGLSARLGIYTDKKSEELVRLVKDHIERAGYDSNMTPHSLFVAVNAADPRLNTSGRVMAAVRKAFGAYWKDFIAEHHTQRGEKKAEPLHPNKIVPVTDFAADVHHVIRDATATGRITSRRKKPDEPKR